MPYCDCSPMCSAWNDEPDYDDDSGLINSYSYKPEPVFHGDGPLFLGTEIEVGMPYNAVNRLARTATDSLGDVAYLKEDGSITGFEIVTHPMSYAYAMEKFPWEVLPELHQDGAYDDDDAAGIHVHVSRDGFAGPGHMYRWMKLIYRNASEVVRFAGRESTQWAPFRRSARRDIKTYVDKRSPDRFYADRYNAINVTNRETLELRIFASSLKPSRVQAALGFTAASVEYAGQLTAYDVAHNDGWSWPSFADWVAPKPEYEPLVARMSDLGIGSAKAAQTCAF